MAARRGGSLSNRGGVRTQLRAPGGSDFRLPSGGSVGRPTAPSQGGLSREPEGLFAGPSRRVRSGYDQAADMYRSEGGYASDPNAAMVYTERDIGVRHPQPYQAAVAEALAPLDWTERCQGVPRPVLYPAQSVAGWREDACGRFGRLPEDMLAYDTVPLTAREQLEYRLGGGRSPGVDPRWDMSAQNQMTSGIIAGTNSFDQRVHPQRPYLRLRGDGGDSRVVVRAGVSRGGGSTSRMFVIGGGFTAAFNLMGMDNVNVQVFAQEVGATLQFIWATEGMEAGDQTLYNPVRIAAGGAATAVPQGAFALILQTTDPAWQWTNTVINAAVPAQTVTVAMTTNVENRVLGTRFIASIANEGVWLVRPI